MEASSTGQVVRSQRHGVFSLYISRVSLICISALSRPTYNRKHIRKVGKLAAGATEDMFCMQKQFVCLNVGLPSFALTRSPPLLLDLAVVCKHQQLILNSEFFSQNQGKRFTPHAFCYTSGPATCSWLRLNWLADLGILGY